MTARSNHRSWVISIQKMELRFRTLQMSQLVTLMLNVDFCDSKCLLPDVFDEKQNGFALANIFRVKLDITVKFFFKNV